MAEKPGTCEFIALDGGDRVPFHGTLSIGRHPFNDLVLGHKRVSGNHALIEWVAGSWKLRDLGSSNGTSLNGKRIRSRRTLKVGDVIRFGEVSAWRVESLVDPGDRGATAGYVERVSSSRQTPIEADRFLIGVRPPCDLVVLEWLAPPCPPIRVVLYEESGGLWAEPTPDLDGLTLDGRPWTDDRLLVERSARLGLGPTELDVVPPDIGHSFDTTERAAPQLKTYDLDLHLHFDGPDKGTIKVVTGDGEWQVHTGQRFILLYVLAAAGGAWVADDDLKIKLWGRNRAYDIDPSTLYKLIHDTRRMFLARGVDGWFVEKQAGRTRLRLPPERLHL